MKSYMVYVFAVLAVIIALGLLLSCASTSEGQLWKTVQVPPAPTPTPVVEQVKMAPLSWEKFPENKPWSVTVFDQIELSFESLDQAKDIAGFCPKYSSLSHVQKVNVIGELFSAVAKYECAWNPKSYSVDVGSKNDKSTWSVGLLQLSVVDQESYGIHYGYSFADLQDPVKNLKLGVAIMAKQIRDRGLYAIPVGQKGLYWATLHPGGKYDETASIQAMVKKIPGCL